MPEQNLPIRPGVPPRGVGLPPGPPPGTRMPLLPVRPGVPPAGVRMPPGPPPGVPPRITRPLLPKPLGVVSAKPQINKSEVKSDSVIESAPVMRNLKSDVTRFIPTNLRIKRDGNKGIKKKEEPHQKPAMFTQQKVVPQEKTKDDAYNDFMREMKDLL
ncbi:WW domain-binding protein 11 [Eurytemora carolleeae]|uniref:WW domain-binding protein 11 n=1 Tax=Eurytemora carolleeae TaxID=1294199 RepID=UPI000C7935DB|nr:WW domain-binding protein 11 [Eurytemora carolleeae]|eukprot:XP_023343827.1 WW domain-binding protein 11-like [Eurytemora affinis]